MGRGRGGRGRGRGGMPFFLRHRRAADPQGRQGERKRGREGALQTCRRYLPVLRGFPAKYIYDPWNAPDSVQAAAKCIIGIHYPKPMVNHAEASRLNIERMKQIYQQLSRYRGLGLLASVPTNHNGNGNGAMMAYSPGEQQTGTSATATTGVSGSKVASGNGSGSILLNFDSEDQPGPSRVQQHGFPTVADPAHRLQQPGSAHEFAVPQHPGRLSHPGGKRELESEREPGGEDETRGSSRKIPRQNTERS